MELRKYEGGGRERLYFFSSALPLFQKETGVFYRNIFRMRSCLFLSGPSIRPVPCNFSFLKDVRSFSSIFKDCRKSFFFSPRDIFKKKDRSASPHNEFFILLFFPDSNFHHLQRLPDLLIRTLWISLFALAQFPAEFCGYDTLPLLCARVLFSQLRSPAHMIDVR